MKSKTWVKIDKDALAHNFKCLAKSVDDQAPKGHRVSKLAVVKSNAYGHGIIECARIFSKAGADFLAVDVIEEALDLRKAGIEKPILVLGWTDPELYPLSAEQNISLTISTMKFLKELPNHSEKFSFPLKIHIKVDTGLHRQGFLPDETDSVLNEISKIKNVEVEGLYTHLAAAEVPSLKKFTLGQLSSFRKWIQAFSNQGLNPVKHAGASAVAFVYPELFFDMVRFGVSLYGLWPSSEIKKVADPKFVLKPALKWETYLTEVKTIAAGEAVGYDCTEKVGRESKIGVIPVGYWHGLPRAASRINHVAINGKKAKILGNVSMDLTVVDVTDIDCDAGSVVELIGETIPAEEMAKSCNTINYEIVTRINQDIPRIYF